MANNDTEITRATCEAEDSLIGSILIASTDGYRNVIDEVAQIITPDHFKQWNDRQIYIGMLACSEAPHQVNVARQLHSMNLLEDGLISHMSFAISNTPTWLDYLNYAHAVIYYAGTRLGIITHRVKGVIL